MVQEFSKPNAKSAGFGTGKFKAECKERGIIITKNTYDEARVAMLETLVYTGTLSDADITAIIIEVTEDVLAQCNTTLETDPSVRLSKVTQIEKINHLQDNRV